MKTMIRENFGNTEVFFIVEDINTSAIISTDKGRRRTSKNKKDTAQLKVQTTSSLKE